MPNCSKCGNPVYGKFCRNCGQAVVETRTQSTNQSYCSTCNTYFEGDFCPLCGKTVAVPPPPPGQVPSQQPAPQPVSQPIPPQQPIQRPTYGPVPPPAQGPMRPPVQPPMQPPTQQPYPQQYRPPPPGMRPMPYPMAPPPQTPPGPPIGERLTKSLAAKIGIFLLIVSISGLILSALIPWIMVEQEIGNDKETFSFNHELEMVDGEEDNWGGDEFIPSGQDDEKRDYLKGTIGLAFFGLILVLLFGIILIGTGMMGVGSKNPELYHGINAIMGALILMSGMIIMISGTRFLGSDATEEHYKSAIDSLGLDISSSMIYPAAYVSLVFGAIILLFSLFIIKKELESLKPPAEDEEKEEPSEPTTPPPQSNLPSQTPPEQQKVPAQSPPEQAKLPSQPPPSEQQNPTPPQNTPQSPEGGGING